MILSFFGKIGERLFPQALEGVTAAVVLRNHAEAGWNAVHGIKLEIMWKHFYHDIYPAFLFNH
jgi:hypothetical protein